MKANVQSSLFRRTKLHRPPVGKDHVNRQHLLDRLNKGLHRPVTLVSAPAGYGKSTLISRWLDISDIPCSWLSLDEQENDLRQFLFSFLAAVQSIFPEAGRGTKAMLDAPNLPPVTVLADTLVNEIDEIDQDFIVVLDDFHFIHEKSVQEFLGKVLRHPPQPMHLVLVGRKDPFLPISTLRARDQLTEVRTHDLRFSASEVKAFVESNLDNPIEDDTAIELAEKTEGWVTGLRLAILAMRGHDDAVGELLELKGTTGYVTEYLITEVLEVQSPAIRKYLLSTSILESFCAPLCDVLCRTDADPDESAIDGNAFIIKLQKENLFPIALDAENHWFRFHHLFQDLLQSQLKRRYSPEEISSLHARAGEWFSENGFIDEAIRHQVAAGDVNKAIQLVEQDRQTLLNNDRWSDLDKWLSALPDTAIEQRPELLLAKAWVHYFKFQHALVLPALEIVESLLNDDSAGQPLFGEIYLFKGVFCYWQGDGLRSLEYIEDALERIPSEYPMIRGFAEIYFGLAGQMQGQKERVDQVLSDLLSEQILDNLRKIRLMVARVWIHMFSGELEVAFMLNRQLLNETTGNSRAAFHAFSLYNQGRIHFQRDELHSAIHYLGLAAEMPYLMYRRADVDCMAGLALAYQAMQQTEEADAALKRLFDFTRSFNDSALSDMAQSCRARVSLMRGEAVSDQDLPNITGKTGTGNMGLTLEIPIITQCRLLLAKGSDADLQKAEEKLQECLQLNRARHNTYQMIGIMALLTLIIDRRGRTDESIELLKQAVAMAEPGGFIHPFVESGRPMANLLKRLMGQDVAPNQLEKILNAFEDINHTAATQASVADTSSPSTPTPQPLIDPLSNRELEILEFLAKRLQNKEIAERLFISPNTVRTHLQNIYQKLDTSNRRQAVAKAFDLGILPGP